MPAERYTLYGVEGSYYAAKTRYQLLRKGIPFDELPCDRAAFAEVIVPRVGYPVVPVVITPAATTTIRTRAPRSSAGWARKSRQASAAGRNISG